MSRKQMLHYVVKVRYVSRANMVYMLFYRPSLSLCGSSGGTTAPCDDARTTAPRNTELEILFPTAKILHNLNAILLTQQFKLCDLWLLAGMEGQRRIENRRAPGSDGRSKK